MAIAGVTRADDTVLADEAFLEFLGSMEQDQDWAGFFDEMPAPDALQESSDEHESTDNS